LPSESTLFILRTLIATRASQLEETSQQQFVAAFTIFAIQSSLPALSDH
jgi:hypothetical protein